MRRILWEIPFFGSGLPVHAYGFMIMLGFVLGIHVAVRRARTVGTPETRIYDLSMIAIFSGVLGARLLHVVENLGQFDLDFVWRAGIDQVLVGAAIGALAWVAAAGEGARWARLGKIFAFLIVFKVVSHQVGVAARFREGFKVGGVEGLDLLALGVLLAMTRGRWRGGTAMAGRLALSMGVGAWVVSRYLSADVHDWSALAIWEGGLVFYGGFLFATGMVVVAMVCFGLGIGRTCDLMAPSVAVGLAFTRLGCYLNGCCWGKPCGSELWGVRYAPGTLPAQVLPLAEGGWTVPAHPTQFLSAFACLVVFVILSAVYRRRRVNGEIFCLFVTLYSVHRFAIEFLRHDTWITRPTEALPWTTSQYISLGLSMAGMIGWWALRRAGVRRRGVRETETSGETDRCA